MSRSSQVIVLAEDVRHQQFIRRYLYRVGYSRHEIDFKLLPEGRGSGEQWVRRQYANAVRDYRVRSARAQTALVVAVDADTGDVAGRLRQFHLALEREGQSPRSSGEAIVHLVPRRSIETWILCLNGTHIDEETDCRHRDLDEQISSSAETFFIWSRPNVQLPDHCVPSLRLAIQEAGRLR